MTGDACAFVRALGGLDFALSLIFAAAAFSWNDAATEAGTGGRAGVPFEPANFLEGGGALPLPAGFDATAGLPPGAAPAPAVVGCFCPAAAPLGGC